MTDEQKFVFDLKGYLLIPEVLTADEIADLKTYIDTLRTNRDSLPPHERGFPGGASQILIDHPVVMDVLHTIIGQDVRMESSWFTYRNKGDGGPPPHGGGRNVNPMFNYQTHNGSIYAALTRVVFELNEVKKGEGGTLFMPGSHKAAFGVPESHRDVESWLFEDYDCPPGSMIVFTENLGHSGVTWKNPDRPRIAIFNCYNHIGCQFHHPTVPQVVIDGLPPERKAFFRPVWTWHGGGPDNGRNLRYPV
ncbi:MAG: phytanoyl-CoA dioxygenase family protein [Candidatus Poribacteria bacterium]|nr:phytanoyl-CoA dioxygenase family protein [Candidatus Poribacteria bacterium]